MKGFNGIQNFVDIGNFSTHFIVLLEFSFQASPPPALVGCKDPVKDGWGDAGKKQVDKKQYYNNVGKEAHPVKNSLQTEFVVNACTKWGMNKKHHNDCVWLSLERRFL